ncbi:MAG: efflux RND transporter periplasmic adaptor subunit [Bacteroidetes bacterium]|nr:efflux RND transporter periplasmic adaptor subunit [Bacteroidota bacterium]
MKVKYIAYALLVVGLCSLIAYRIDHNKSQDESGKDKGPKKPIKVSGMIVQPQRFDNQLSLTGALEANEQVEIRSEVSGVVQSIHFQEGSQVQKGQLLVKINDSELRAQLRQAKTKESLAAENERRARLLLAKEAISQEEYDISLADYKSAQAQSQLISAQLDKTSIRAPFSGKIGLRSISPGSYLTPSTLIAKLVNTGQLKITFSIPEKYAGQIKNNTVLNFKVANSEQVFKAKIYALEPGIEAATRTLQVRACTENANNQLIPGTFANIDLPLDEIKDAVVVPSEAIVPVQNGKKVYVVKGGKATESMVTTATRTDASILILTGLNPGDTLITSGVMTLKNEAPVQVKLKS